MEDKWSRAPESSHLKHAVFRKLKPGVFVVVASSALPRKAIQVEQRYPMLWRPRLWRPRLWQDLGTFNRFQYVRAQVLFSCHAQLRIAESTKKHTRSVQLR